MEGLTSLLSAQLLCDKSLSSFKPSVGSVRTLRPSFCPTMSPASTFSANCCRCYVPFMTDFVEILCIEIVMVFDH